MGSFKSCSSPDSEAKKKDRHQPATEGGGIFSIRSSHSIQGRDSMKNVASHGPSCYCINIHKYVVARIQPSHRLSSAVASKGGSRFFQLLEERKKRGLVTIYCTSTRDDVSFSRPRPI